MTAAQKAQLDIKNVSRPADVQLMRLMWAYGWRMPTAQHSPADAEEPKTLMPHQFQAVRFVAGIADSDWPAEFPPATLPRRHSGGGGILADSMGLGKTVECLGGIWVREILDANDSASDPGVRTTLIVSPNKAVSQQWKAHALAVGFATEELDEFIGTRKSRAKWHGIPLPRLTLTTIHVLQSECRTAFKTFSEAASSGRITYSPSPLAPHLHADRAYRAHQLYLQAKGLRAPKSLPSRRGGCSEKNIRECMANDLRSRNLQRQKKPFLTVVVDEAHFVRNPLSFWGILTAALGTHCRRLILATGTPFNNRFQDMAALCSYYDPRRSNLQRDVKWWKDAFAGDSGEPVDPALIKRQLTEWWATCILRRDQSVIRELLPRRHKFEHSLSLSDREMAYYLPTETHLVKCLQAFVALLNKPASGSPVAQFFRQRRLKRMQQQVIHDNARIEQCR